MKIEIFKTKDLGEASTLLASNKKLIKTEHEGATCFFLFNNSEECKKIIDQYYFGKVLLNARDHYEAVKRLKTLIFRKVGRDQDES